MSLVSFGIVLQLDECEAGYYKLVVRTETPFDFQYLRFCVWKQKSLNINGLRVTVGECVKVLYEKAKFLKLKAIERAFVDNCKICGAFFENDMNIQSPTGGSEPGLSRLRQRKYKQCNQCSIIPENERKECVNRELKLIGKTTKQYTYSHGTSLTFVDKDSEKYYFTIVYENDPICSMISDLKAKHVYLVQGWVKTEIDDGYVMKLMNIKECYNETTQ